MSPQEWWWVFDAKMEAAKKIQDATAKQGYTASADAWERARQVHREKMKKHGTPTP